MTDKTDNQPNKSPQVKLTGRMLNFTRLNLQGDDSDSLFDKIGEKLGKQQNSKLPVVVSYDGTIAIRELWEKLWEFGLQPIGIIPNDDEQNEQATAQKIAIFPADGQRIDGKTKKHHKESDNEKPSETTEKSQKATDNPVTSENTTDKTADEPAKTDDKTDETTDETNVKTTDDKEKSVTDELIQPVETENPDTPKDIDNENSNKLKVNQGEHNQNVEGDLVHHQMLRSGQSINHVGGDVILTKGVNAGAEAITDYSLHIYGKAEGRLVAGATGDKNARIFCMKFNPSLVSVAGTYCLKENIPPEFLNKAVEVSFDDEKGLVFSLIE